MSDTDTTTVVELTLDDEQDLHFKVNPSKRTLSGMILPWSSVATDSRGMGRWQFQRGSVRWSQVSRVKLLRDHDMTNPVGKAVAIQDRQDGLYGTFQVARGEKGDEVLSLAEDGVLDGFSVGAVIEPDGWEVADADRGVRLVTNATMKETTITAVPAYDDARVHHVAAMLWISEEGSMSDDNKDEKGGKGGATTLDTSEAAMERFEAELNTRFDKLTEKLSEVAETQQESVTKIIAEAFEAAYTNIQDPSAGQRAEMAAARIRVGREEPVYRFDGDVRAASMVKDFWRAQTERDADAVERLRKFQAQQRDMVDLLQKMPPDMRANFAVTTGNASSVLPPGYRPDLFVNELRQGRPIVAQMSRGTITDATPFTVPRFVSSSGATDDHVEGVNPSEGTLTLDTLTVSPGAISGRFVLTREIVDAANPAIDAIALAAMREDYNRQTEVKAYAELNVDANVASFTNADLSDLTSATPATQDTARAKALSDLRDILARYPFTRFASPTGAVMGQLITQAMANAKDSTGRPLLPSIGATNTAGLGNAVDQGWFVDGLPFVPAWAITQTAGDELALVLNRADVWAWESPLLTFRFEEKLGPANIELALFSYFATKVLRPAGIFSLRAVA